MNKPAPKEPSMDEILSSIRQIIADDDAAMVPRKPPGPAPAATQPAPAPVPRPIPMPPIGRRDPAPAAPSQEAEPEPLALTPAQMLPREEPAEEPFAAGAFADLVDDAGGATDLSMAAALVYPEDITFAADEIVDLPLELEHEPEPEPVPVALVAPAPVRPIPIPPAAPMPQMAAPPQQVEAPAVMARPAPTIARAAPMPDPQLSADIAETLLEPTTDAAVKANFAKLNGLSMMGAGITLDALMREMLRPMLKEWLDENLPSLVERMVEKEIARISRGE